MITIPESLTNPGNLYLQPHVRYILSCLEKDQVFLIVPQSNIRALNPRDLPRETILDDGTAMPEEGHKRKGRPARREKSKKARIALDELDEWLSETVEPHQGSSDAIMQYKNLKEAMLDAKTQLPLNSLEDATSAVVGRLEEAQTRVENQSVAMLKRVVAGNSKGIFGLM